MAVALPMESNPETMSKYLHRLGVSDKWRMVDVIGLEGEALDWVPKPVLAVILLFPLSDSYELTTNEEEIETKNSLGVNEDIFHLKQVLRNVCGTIALVHCVANNVHHIELNNDGLLKKYIEDAKGLDSAGRGELLENSSEMLEAYREIINTEGAEGGEEEEPVRNHFVTFIHKDGKLYELDGRRSFPIEHGETTAERLLEDAAKVCRQFIEREPDNLGFNVVALVPAD